MSKVKFGNVVVKGAKPSAEVLRVNIKRSSEALERVTKKIVRPGVVIRAKKDVPQYSIADGETAIFVRRLNGKIKRGRLVNGYFQVID